MYLTLHYFTLPNPPYPDPNIDPNLQLTFTLTLLYLTLPYLALPYITYEDEFEDEAANVTLPYLTLPHICVTLPYLKLPFPFNLTSPYITLPYLT